MSIAPQRSRNSNFALPPGWSGALEWGLLWLVLSFMLYVLGALPAAIAPAQLVELWGLPLDEYLQRTQAPVGWGWLAHLAQGEGAGLAGIAVLAGCVVPGLLAAAPLYLQRGDRLYAALCLAQVAVLAMAASDRLWFGH